MKQRFILGAALAAAALLTACGGGGSGGGSMSALPSAPPTMPAPSPVASNAPATAPASLAQLLGSPGWTSPNGFTLYVFAADAANVSNCNGACAVAWPPLTASANAAASGNFTVIMRSDGTHQWAYKSRPLYNYSGDVKAGDTHGNGLNQFGGVWTVARP